MSPETNINETISLNGFNVKVNITQKSTVAEATRAIDTVGAALSTAEGSAERLRFAMGRLLNHVRDYDLYKEQFETFEAFTEEVGKKHRLSRATLRDSMMIAERLPDLTSEQAEKIPMTNLTLVARAAKTATPAKVRSILKNAETMTRADLKEKLEKQDLIIRRGAPPVSESKATIRLIVSKHVAEQWERIRGDRDAGEVFAEIVAAALPAQRKKAA